MLVDNDKKMCLDFLLCCYFGQSKNLLKAAIDRAYIDMAAHTLRGFENNNDKWTCRLKASIYISEKLSSYPDKRGVFESWHNDVIKHIITIYKNKIILLDGQAQKWLNMTIKYLYVFRIIVGENDSRLQMLNNFFKNTDVMDYKIPIDSYVLKESGMKDVAWSGLNAKRYAEISDKIGDDKDFLWELEMWENLSMKYGTNDIDSYPMFYKMNKKSMARLGNSFY